MRYIWSLNLCWFLVVIFVFSIKKILFHIHLSVSVYGIFTYYPCQPLDNWHMSWSAYSIPCTTFSFYFMVYFIFTENFYCERDMTNNQLHVLSRVPFWFFFSFFFVIEFNYISTTPRLKCQYCWHLINWKYYFSHLIRYLRACWWFPG